MTHHSVSPIYKYLLYGMAAVCDTVCCIQQAYIDRYNYQHTPVLGAVDEHANVAFSLHVDKVRMY